MQQRQHVEGLNSGLATDMPVVKHVVLNVHTLPCLGVSHDPRRWNPSRHGINTQRETCV